MVKKQKQYSYLTPEQIKVVERGQKSRAKKREEMEFRKATEYEERQTPAYKIKKGGSKLTRAVRKAKRNLAYKREGKKRVKRREVSAKGILGALGVTQASRYSGPGRPRGSYKHGIPIHEYKRKLSAKKAMLKEYKEQQQMDLQRRGLTPEQIQQLQMARATEELQQARMPQQMPQQVVQQQMPEQRLEEIRIIPQRPTQRPQVDAQQRLSRERGYPQHTHEVADDELRFQEWRANNTVSPNTQRLLTQIRRIQNKGKSDNIAQQRRHWERRLVGANTNLMKAHENMINVHMDFTGIPEDNILMAPNVFKENPDNNILRTNRFNLMQTREAGNNLKFF